MRPILFRLPWLGWPVRGYGFALFVAFLLSIWFATRLARRVGIDPNRIIDLGLSIFLSGLIGGRLFFIIQFHDQINSFADIFKIWQGGLVFYGGVITGLAAFVVFVRYHRLPVLEVMDVLAAPIAFGSGVGRFGCLLNGCCWGKVAHVPWAIRFPADSLPWQAQVRDGFIDSSAAWSLPVHPTQLYLVAAGLLTCLITLVWFKYRRRPGETVIGLMAGYGITRFVIEFYRADVPIVWAGLTIAQLLSIGLLIGAALYAAWLYSYVPPLSATKTPPQPA